jgi:CDGSH-type Zn-finger protein/uncharacterized Fe-S cluster protein YjdI
MTPSREQLIHRLYEAAELEHNLMCTYLYAAFSLDAEAHPLVAQWRRTIIAVATEEMAHLAAVWNITSALGGTPQFGRTNFPLEPGLLPASIVVKLAPFSRDVIQHFVHLERPADSSEPEGAGFEPELRFSRGSARVSLTPMALDYETVGAFYKTLDDNLRAFVAAHGAESFIGDPELQLSQSELPLPGVRPVKCLDTALAAMASIVEQGEGAPGHSEQSHFAKFAAIREELATLPEGVRPAFPAATNPVLRPPLRREGRIWIEDDEAARTVDLANACYAIMLRLLAYSYGLPRSSPEKGLVIELSLSLMRAVTLLGERAARLPAGPSHPHCNAGMSFTALRDASPLPPGAAARKFFNERIAELAAHAASLSDDERATPARHLLTELAARTARGFAKVVVLPLAAPAPAPAAAPPTTNIDGVEIVEGEKLTILYEGVKCIHSRHCVTEAPTVFLANVKGPWIHPDTMDAERLVEVAHECPSGAIRYRRKDGRPEEQPPPVNLIRVRESGPYAVRADIDLDGHERSFRATLCRCGASKHKPFCDGSHHDIHFAASGEPATDPERAAMLEVRNGPLSITPTTDGPLAVRGNLEIISGTGRMVVRVQSAKLCRCGGSATKPFCDGTHQRIGFRS